MPDPASPSSSAPEPPPIATEAAAAPSPVGATGLPRNVAAGLALVIPLVGGIAALFLEKRDPFVRFYAVQSIVLGALLAMTVMMREFAVFIFSPIPWLGGVLVWVVQLIYGVFALVWFVVWVVAMAMAFMDREWAIPYVGGLARRKFPARVR